MIKRSIIGGLFSLTLFLGFNPLTPPAAQAQGISLQQLVQLFISLGIIPASKAAAAEAAIGMTPSSISATQPIGSDSSLYLASAEQNKSLGTGTFTAQGTIVQLLDQTQLAASLSRYLDYVGTVPATPYVVVIQDTSSKNSPYEGYFLVSADLFRTLSVGDVVQVTGQFGGGFLNEDGGSYNTKYISLVNNQITLVSHKSSQYVGNSTVTTTMSGVSYMPLGFSSYQNSSFSYLGKKVALSGLQDSFIPQAGYGTSNFIEITNPFDPMQPKIELEVDNSAAYNQAVSALADKSNPIHLFLRVYGTAAQPQSFTSSNTFGTRTLSVPVIDASEIDQCLAATADGSSVTYVAGNLTCTMWSAITGTPGSN
jgi:hypothetical protein